MNIVYMRDYDVIGVKTKLCTYVCICVAGTSPYAVTALHCFHCRAAISVQAPTDWTWVCLTPRVSQRGPRVQGGSVHMTLSSWPPSPTCCTRSSGSRSGCWRRRGGRGCMTQKTWWTCSIQGRPANWACVAHASLASGSRARCVVCVCVCVRVYCTFTELALHFALVAVFPSQLVEMHHTHYPSLNASCTSGMCICLALCNMHTCPTLFWMCMCVCTAVSGHHSRPWVLWQGRRPLVPTGGKVSEVPRHRGDAGQWRGGPQETAHHCKWEGQRVSGRGRICMGRTVCEQ